MTNTTSAHFQLFKKTTEVKLRELSKHERKLDEHYAGLLQTIDTSASQPSAERRKHLAALHDGVKDLQVVQTAVHTDIGGIDELVAFASADPWTTAGVVQQRMDVMLHEVQQKRTLWRHNKLLGALLTASLNDAEQAQLQRSLKSTTQAINDDNYVDDDSASDASDFVTVDDAGPLMGLTKDETQTRLESIFFAADTSITEESVLSFLQSSVFVSTATWSKEKTKRVQDALKTAHSSFKAFSESFLTSTTVSDTDILACVRAMLRDKSGFSDDIAAFLQDVKSNTEMQRELAQVLTIQLSNLDEFAWPASGVSVVLKRGMNGRFRCHLLEDALTALLFQFVGTTWGVECKRIFTDLLASLDDAPNYIDCSIDAHRREWIDRFRMSALPSSLDAGAAAYDPDASSSSKEAETPTISKQDIVRLVCTEAHLVHQLQAPGRKDKSTRGITAVTTDLEFFGPSVSHAAVFATLQFLGVSDAMLDVFRAYTQIPLVFPGAKAPRKMQRGLSVGRMMTMFLSEVLLFVMDYHVLATTDVSLFRKHDDIWLFDASAQKVTSAWTAMHTAATALGLRFNAAKSGSQRVVVCATIADDSDDVEMDGTTTPSEDFAATSDSAPTTALSSTELPPQQIKWGLLVLRANGTVQIAAPLVAAFATEMADRLDAATSILAWINVYNKYMGFFLRNLSGASPVFGLDAVDEVLATLTTIHKRVFHDTDGDVLAHLRAKIAVCHPDLVGSADDAKSTAAPLSLPAAWVHWHTSLGGLGLFNPFLAVWMLKHPMNKHAKDYHRHARHSSSTTTTTTTAWQAPFSTVFERDIREPYELFAESFAAHGAKSASANESDVMRFLCLKSATVRDDRRWGPQRESGLKINDSYQLRPFHEYLTLVPRVHMSRLFDEYTALLGEVDAQAPDLRASQVAQKAAGKQLDAASIKDAYWRYVALIYGDELLEAFGTVAFFSHELLPAQLIQSIKTTAVAF